MYPNFELKFPETLEQYYSVGHLSSSQFLPRSWIKRNGHYLETCWQNRGYLRQNPDVSQCENDKKKMSGLTLPRLSSVPLTKCCLFCFFSTWKWAAESQSGSSLKQGVAPPGMQPEHFPTKGANTTDLGACPPICSHGENCDGEMMGWGWFWPVIVMT